MNATLPIHEMFMTFQGEGVHMGKPAFFLRTFGCPVHCPWCFGEGVRLHTARGRIDISKIRVGDLVWSFNEKTQKQEWTTVLAVESRQAEDHYEMTWRHKSVHFVTAKVTGEHPFWVVGRGWTEAKDLQPKISRWEGNGRHIFNPNWDVLLEIDAKAYVLAMRAKVASNPTDTTRAANSLRMSKRNPMFAAAVREKVSKTLKRNIRSAESENVLARMWKQKSFRKIVTKRMIETNPCRDPIAHAKSCDRPFGMVSKVEELVARVIAEHGLPFMHNKGKHYIGGRVPDFVSTEKKKVIEVPSPDYLQRQENGYHDKNREHYAKHGFECRTLYVNRNIQAEREVLESLTEYAYNGKELLRKTKVDKPLTVYSLRTENHTFFVEGVLTHNCDSAGTWHPDYIPKNILRATTAQLLNQIMMSPGAAQIVVITGGEPAIHDLTELTQKLNAAGYATHLETSGSFPIKGDFDWITLSPKRWKVPLEANVTKAHEFKIIVGESAVEDINYYMRLLADLGLRHITAGRRPIWLHPEWSQHKNPYVLKAIGEAVKHSRIDDLRAGWQLHKLYAVDTQDPRSRPTVPLGGNPALGL